jgi:lysophospholipase L1-like esterase
MSHDETWRSQRMTADGLHPNTLGYQDLLEAVLNWSELSQYHCQVDYHLKLEHT